MNKKQFFLEALKAQAYLKTAWVIGAFAQVAEGPDEWKSDPYPYRIVPMPHAKYFVDPNDTTALVQIEGSTSAPLFRALEEIALEVGDVANVVEKTITTYGNTLVNSLCLVYPFGSTIPFIKGRMSARAMEALILDLFEDDPVEGVAKRPGSIVVSEYITHCNAVFNLAAFTQLFVPAATYKTMTPPPDVARLRDELLLETVGRHHDATVVAGIAKELQAYDAAYLQGDPGMGFLTSEKALKIVRSKLFLMYGAEPGLLEKVDVTMITNSLTEGWDIEKFPEMNNALRAGSYFRGKQTELGGSAVKDLLRASSNMRITDKDCGSSEGVYITAYASEESKLIGYTAIEPTGEQNKITKENVGSYLAKAIKLRSGMFCKFKKTDYCATCLGDTLATNPTGISMAIADYGSTFLAIYMSAAHSKGLTVATLDWNGTLS